MLTGNISDNASLLIEEFSPPKWRLCGRSSNRPVHEVMNGISNVKGPLTHILPRL